MIEEKNIRSETITELVASAFEIEDVTIGTKKLGYVCRYHVLIGEQNTENAFNELKSALEPYAYLPLLRPKGHKYELLIISTPRPGKNVGAWVNLLMFILTALSVLFAGALYSATEDPFAGKISFENFLKFLIQGWSFAISFLLILAAHEFGHYFAGKIHKVNVSLPYFIPFPFSFIGTMGAYINMKEPPLNKKHLFDIAVAGPLMGLLVSIPILIVGLNLSSVESIPSVIPQGTGFQIEGNSILYLFLKFITFGKLLPQPVSYGNLSPFLYWLRYFFSGIPLPLGGIDVIIHPVAWAGWAGLLVTSLNLIPAGQLDGGHIFHVLFGKSTSRKILPVILMILALLGFVWNGWWLWVILIIVFGRSYSEPLDQVTQLDRPRKILAIIVMIVLILIFMPVPLIMLTG
ncbi:MAG: site-2 protease family protein [Anaerolineaceae bacterium]|nr:site-2 protease family protein [Anaerolineaceae bacterium]